MDKTEAKRRKDFLAELARAGNLTLAAERAKVSRSWALRRRRDDPAFREQVEAAIRAAHGRLAEAESSGPAGRWRTQDGHELVIQHGGRRFVQVRRARRKQWTPRTEARFLHALAATCNVRAAVREAETTFASAYRHRERWPDFARRWDAALEEGYDRLSTLIVANAGKVLGDPDMVPEVELTGMTFDTAIQALHLHRRQIHGDGQGGRARGWWRKPRTLDDMRASIIRKLECMARADEAEVAAIEAAGITREDGR